MVQYNLLGVTISRNNGHGELVAVPVICCSLIINTEKGRLALSE